jgi:hypothetical protein
MLDPEMIEGTAKIVNEAMMDKVQVNLIINNRAGGNAPLIAEKIVDRLHNEKQQGYSERFNCSEGLFISACFPPPIPVYFGH